MTSRRTFLRHASVATLAGVIPARVVFRRQLAELHPAIDPAAGPRDPMLRELAFRAIDAARQAGATYADVRFTADRRQTVSPDNASASVTEDGAVYVAVRALVANSWGVASAPDCTANDVVRLARAATAQASVNQWSTAHPIQLDAYPPTATGDWSTPCGRDPFQVSVDEKSDLLQSCVRAPELLGLSDVTVQTELVFRRQEKVFASTAGAYLTQTLSWVGPCTLVVTRQNPVTGTMTQVTAPAVALQSGGYELLAALRPHERIPALVEETYRQQQITPVQLGRYTVVFDADTTAALVSGMIGRAIELDRVRGDEINAGGTSYLTTSSLGQPIAHPTVTITGSRSLPHGPAAVAWDDDGVVPESFPIVTDGVLVDFATSRADASSLNSWYAQRHQPVRSHGCAMAESAADMPTVCPPDLTVSPATSASSSATFEDLIAEARNGVVVLRGNCDMDREQRSGQISGTLYEVRNGRVGRYLGPSAVLSVRSSDLWRNVVALGGPSSAVLHGFALQKGEPQQRIQHGVVAVPMVVRNLALLDAQQG